MLFADDPKPMYVIPVTKGAKFLGIKVLPDGIYAYYSIENEEELETMAETFYILGDGHEVPKDSLFVEVLDVVGDIQGETRQLILPVFKLPSLFKA